MGQRRIDIGYVFDTSILIQLKEYPPDIFGLQDDISRLIGQNLIVSPKQVFAELTSYAREDDAVIWAKRNSSIFIDLDEDQISELKNILNRFPKLVDFNKTTEDADPFIIAIAKSRGWIVVTREKARDDLNKPKIPDVCQELKIECMDLFEMCRNEGWNYKP